MNPIMSLMISLINLVLKPDTYSATFSLTLGLALLDLHPHVVSLSYGVPQHSRNIPYKPTDVFLPRGFREMLCTMLSVKRVETGKQPPGESNNNLQPLYKNICHGTLYEGEE
jgi:hypothetical protein